MTEPSQTDAERRRRERDEARRQRTEAAAAERMAAVLERDEARRQRDKRKAAVWWAVLAGVVVVGLLVAVALTQRQNAERAAAARAFSEVELCYAALSEFHADGDQLQRDHAAHNAAVEALDWDAGVVAARDALAGMEPLALGMLDWSARAVSWADACGHQSFLDQAEVDLFLAEAAVVAEDGRDLLSRCQTFGVCSP